MLIIIAYRPTYPLCSYWTFCHLVLRLSYDKLSVDRVLSRGKDASIRPVGIFHGLLGGTHRGYHWGNGRQSPLLGIFDGHPDEFFIGILARLFKDQSRPF